MQTSTISFLVLSLVAPGLRPSPMGPGSGLDLRVADPDLTALPVQGVWGDPGHPRWRPAVPGTPGLHVAARGGGAASAAEAAEQARRQTGGKVLAVERTGGGYQVKVLTPAGEVRMVFIAAAGG